MIEFMPVYVVLFISGYDYSHWSLYITIIYASDRLENIIFVYYCIIYPVQTRSLKDSHLDLPRFSRKGGYTLDLVTHHLLLQG